MNSRLVRRGWIITSLCVAWPGLASGGGPPGWVESAVERAAALSPAAFDAAPRVDLLQHHSIRIDKNGRRRHRKRVAAQFRAGYGNAGAQFVEIDSHWQRIERFQGWHVDPSGKVHGAGKPVITQSGGELYTETKEHSLHISMAREGSLVACESEVEDRLTTDRTMVLPIADAGPVVDWACSISLPEGWQATAARMVPATDEPEWLEPYLETADGDRRVLTWRFADVWVDEVEEPLSRGTAWLRPYFVLRLAAGTAGDQTWDELAAWYAELSAESLKDAARLKDHRLLEALTRDPARPAAAVVGAAVRDAMEYVQIYLDDGSYRPRDILEIAETGYGDCKDMTHMVIGLLQSAGIEALPALATVDVPYMSWPAIPSLTSFDHCIVAVPRGEAYDFFDPTARYVPWGALPPWLEGSRALVARPQGGRLVELPVSPAGDHHRSLTATVEIDPAYAGRCSVNAVLSGHNAVIARAHLRSGGSLGDLVRTWLCPRLDGSVEVEEGSSKHLETSNHPVVLTFTLRLDALGRRAGQRWFLQPDLLTSDPTPRFDAEERRSDVVFDWAGSQTTEVTIKLPDGVSVDHVPQDVEFTNAWGEYTRRTAAGEGALRLERRLATKVRTVPRDAYLEAKRWDEARARGDGEQVVLLVQ